LFFFNFRVFDFRIEINNFDEVNNPKNKPIVKPRNTKYKLREILRNSLNRISKLIKIVIERQIIKKIILISLFWGKTEKSSELNEFSNFLKSSLRLI
jgi:hypothetical protein